MWSGGFLQRQSESRWEYEAVSRPDQRPPSSLQMMNGRNLASGSAEKRRFINRQGGDFSPLFSTRSMFVFRPAESGLFVETGMGVVSLRPGFWDFLCEFPENNIKKAETRIC